jgi:hypothetical protein
VRTADHDINPIVGDCSDMKTAGDSEQRAANVAVSATLAATATASTHHQIDGRATPCSHRCKTSSIKLLPWTAGGARTRTGRILAASRPSWRDACRDRGPVGWLLVCVSEGERETEEGEEMGGTRRCGRSHWPPLEGWPLSITEHSQVSTMARCSSVGVSASAPLPPAPRCPDLQGRDCTHRPTCKRITLQRLEYGSRWPQTGKRTKAWAADG